MANTVRSTTSPPSVFGGFSDGTAAPGESPRCKEFRRSTMFKRARFLVALFIAWLPSVQLAWAGYDARASELKTRLDAIKFVDRHDLLVKAVDDYLKARNECLDAL